MTEAGPRKIWRSGKASRFCGQGWKMLEVEQKMADVRAEDTQNYTRTTSVSSMLRETWLTCLFSPCALPRAAPLPRSDFPAWTRLAGSPPGWSARQREPSCGNASYEPVISPTNPEDVNEFLACGP